MEMAVTMGRKIVSALSCFRSTEGKITMVAFDKLTPEKTVRLALGYRSLFGRNLPDLELRKEAQKRLFMRPDIYSSVLVEYALNCRFKSGDIKQDLQRLAREFIFSHQQTHSYVYRVLEDQINNPRSYEGRADFETGMHGKSVDARSADYAYVITRHCYIRKSVIDMLKGLRPHVSSIIQGWIDELLIDPPKLEEVVDGGEYTTAA